MIEGSTHFNLLDNTLDIILYREPTRKIDMYCYNLLVSLNLGTRVMKDALYPIGNFPVL